MISTGKKQGKDLDEFYLTPKRSVNDRLMLNSNAGFSLLVGRDEIEFE